MKGDHPYSRGQRISYHYRAADTRRGGGYSINRCFREERLNETLMGDLDALLKAEPGSEEAAAAALQIKTKRLQKSGLGNGDGT